MSNASFIVGIDLGTTNCTMAYTPMKPEDSQNVSINQVSILQALNVQTLGSSTSFPSFIYYPLPEELQIKAAEIPWNAQQRFTIGAYARDRGSEVPTRLISSAKSWLCHPGINRREKILPIAAEDSNHQMSPLEACSEILRHLREAWNQAMPKFPFKEQVVLITVPASFDPSARQLIQEASQEAGYSDVILLEEPQAAFYAWLHTHANDWRQELKIEDTILVIDIGGGTTDFSLITVAEEEGNLLLKRQAVGSHLLLGGDNIDLGLAYLIKEKIEAQGHALDHWQIQALVHQCRQAKERMMGDDAPQNVDVTVLGRGSRLIGNTLKAVLTQEEVKKYIIDAFIPIVDPGEQSPNERRAGIQQIGLPYVQDPRISCQLAKFLSMTGESSQPSMDRFIVPTAVLFNGGTLRSSHVREQIMHLLNLWAVKFKKPPVKELVGVNYDDAVSRGAAYYGLARQGHAVRIRGGTNRSYFIGVEEAMPAVPGINPPMRAICIVPFGLEEGDQCQLDDQEFSLVLGEQATFRFFSHATPQLSDGNIPSVGAIIRNWKQELTELHPIEALLDKSGGDGKTVRVKLASKVTELGMLELWCLSADGRKWKLEFDIREKNLSSHH